MWLDESYHPDYHVSDLVGTDPHIKCRWPFLPRVHMGSFIRRGSNIRHRATGIKCPACPLVIPAHMYGYHYHLDVAGVEGADESCHRFEVCSVIICVCVVLKFKLWVWVKHSGHMWHMSPINNKNTYGFPSPSAPL